MGHDETFEERLRVRLLTAVGVSVGLGLGVGTIACRKPASTIGESPLEGVDAAATPTPKTPTPVSSIRCMNGAAQEMCVPPRTPARSTGTGEPAPAPPPSAFDSNGCLPPSLVSDGCCNPGRDGPTVKDGKCCYHVCPDICCGRPFVVHGVARLPDLEREGTAPRAVALDDAVAHALAREWLDDARMEHASVASFSAFALRLLALGAPPALVREALRAADDEIAHAASCFAVAARLTGERMRAGALPIAGALEPQSPAALVAATIVEGCVGETIAAVIAAEQRDVARDPIVRDALARIADDEARHAELAVRFVAWAIHTFGDDARAAARRAIEDARAAVTSEAARGASTSPTAARAEWHAFGRLFPDERAAAIARAWRDVVAPAMDALLRADCATAIAPLAQS